MTALLRAAVASSSSSDHTTTTTLASFSSIDDAAEIDNWVALLKQIEINEFALRAEPRDSERLKITRILEELQRELAELDSGRMVEKLQKMRYLRKNIELLKTNRIRISNEMHRHHYNGKQLLQMLCVHWTLLLTMFVLSIFSMHQLAAFLLLVLYLPVVSIEVMWFAFLWFLDWPLSRYALRAFVGISVSQLVLSMFFLVYRVVVVFIDRAFKIYWFDYVLIVMQCIDMLFPILYIYAADQIGFARGQVSLAAHVLHTDAHISHPQYNTATEIALHRRGR